MVSIKSPEQVTALPQYGGMLELTFDSRKDIVSQIKEHLTHSTLMVNSSTVPKPFSEFKVKLLLPDQSNIPDSSVRLLQTVLSVNDNAKPEGFVLQLLSNANEIVAALNDYLQKEGDSSKVEGTPSNTSSRVNRLSIHQELRKMTTTQRAIHATKADKTTRSILARDNEPQVVMFLLKNPRITKQEIVELSKSKSLGYQAVQLIIGNKQWVQYEDIRFNLVMNPKTPLQIVLKLLKTLNMKHTRELAKNHGIKTQIKQAALRIVIERTR